MGAASRAGPSIALIHSGDVIVMKAWLGWRATETEVEAFLVFPNTMDSRPFGIFYYHLGTKADLFVWRRPLGKGVCRI